MHCCVIRWNISTSWHPQSESTSEIMDRMIGKYLRCYVSFDEKDLDQLLTSAEFAYKSSQVESMKMFLFPADLVWMPRLCL